MSVVLDSWAIIEWLRDHDPAASLVDDVISVRPRPVVSWINLAEVHYRSVRDHGRRKATEITSDLEEALQAELPTRVIVLAAADLKAEHPIAFADCFAIATAAAFSLELWTGDPEILDRRSALPCAVRDLR